MSPGTQREVPMTDGLHVAYSDFGPPSGPTLVLCHGLCASGRQLEADARYFASEGYRVLLPDLRGHGRSPAPAGLAADFSLGRLAEDMFDVIEDAGVDQVHWLGNSLGGIVGLAMLSEKPRCFASFATFGTAFRLDLPKPAPIMLPLLYRLLGRKVLGRATAAMTTQDPAARRIIAEMIADVDPAVMARIADGVRRYDFIDVALDYDRPMLLIRGGRDHLVNLGLGSTLAALRDHPRFRQVNLDEAGHCANLDLPDRVRSILLEFWREAGAGPEPTPPANAVGQTPTA